MDETDLGRELISRLRELMGVESGWAEGDTRFQWPLWGAPQRGWSEPATGGDGWPGWRLQLRTSALEGFTGSEEQQRVLAAEISPPTLAGLVRSPGRASRLELASSLDVRGAGVGWVLWLLAVAGRVQAAEARRLSESARLAAVGLEPAVDLAASVPAALREHPWEVLIGAGPLPGHAPRWSAADAALCIDALRSRSARAVATPGGLTATFAPGGRPDERSLLELRSAVHPLLGEGIASELRVPLAFGLLQAMALNEREVGPRGRGDALGGWWPTRAGLAHCAFHPRAFRPAGFGVELALAYARRAGEADAAGGG